MKKFTDKLMKYRLFTELCRMFRYGLVGIVNTCITTGIFILFKHLGVEYLVYTIIGYGVGICISYFLNRKFTFKRDNEKATRQILLFFAVCLSLMGIVELIQYLLIDLWQMKEWLGVSIGMVFYTGTGYILNRNIVFKSTDKTEADTSNNGK